MKVNRRDFLRVIASVCGASIVGSPSTARAFKQRGPVGKESVGVLVDTTRCIGCRSCEAACNEVNKLPKPKASLYDQSVFEKRRRTDAKAYTVVNAYTDPAVPFDPASMGKRITAKTQCMHCEEP
ncbi:MAG: hypothetical protein ACE5JL_17210, partial [Dehalococcoidia bacterium]